MFNNEDGMEIDLKMIPKLSAAYYSSFLDSQSSDAKNTTILYTLGNQLGLGQQLFSARGQKVVPAFNFTLYGSITASLALLVGFIVYLSRRERNGKATLQEDEE